jgi:Protein of unknown function (DUF3037)
MNALMNAPAADATTAVCHYALVHFLPFAETGEFCNVGVVMFSPSARFFDFKLLKPPLSRITNFFRQLDGDTVAASLDAMADELQRVRAMLMPLGVDRRSRALDRAAATQLWLEILKPRASTIRFSESRLVMANGPRDKLNELYSYYVERT